MEDSALNRYLDEIGRESLLTDAEERELSMKIQGGDERALSKLVEANLKFVVSVARQYKGKTALTILNGTSKPATMEVERYAEVIGNVTKAKDILTGRYYDLSKNLELKPRQSLIIEY